MEISQAPLPLPVESQMQRRYRKQLTVIKARQTEDTKMLQHVFAHEIFRRTKDLLGFIVRDQKLVRSIAAFSNLSVDVTNEIYSQSYTTQPTQRALIESTRFLYNIQRILTPEENYVLSQYIESRINDNSASVPRTVNQATNEELEQCFSSLGIDYKQASLTAIKEAIQSIIPSKQDIEITAQVIEKEIQRHDIDYKFPVFSEDNYFQEFFTIINGGLFKRELIKTLDFSYTFIKVVPNILGAFTNLSSLYFFHCIRLILPPDLKGNQGLRRLSFARCTNLTVPPDLSSNHDLTELSFSRCPNLETPPDLSGNGKLTHLCFTGCTNLTAPPDLSHNPALISLSFDGCISLTELPDLSHNPALTKLWFNRCTSLIAPPDLSTLTQLRALDVRGVFPENSELNRNVIDDLEAAQALIRAIETYRFASQVINLDEEELSGFVSSSDEDSNEAQVQFSALPEVEETQERKSRCRFNSGCHIL